MTVGVVCFFGAHFSVPISDGGLALQLIGCNVMIMLLVLVKDVRHKGGGD